MYLALLRGLERLIGSGARETVAQAAILVSVGAVVAVITRFLGNSGGVELMVDNIHVLGGTDDLRQLRSLIPASLLCIGAGGSMGPEAPLVQTSGSFGTWIARRFALDPPAMRVLTITGMATGFAVLFGAPLGAALFALEILHRRGLQYHEAVLPAVVGALTGYTVNFVASGLGLDPVWRLPSPGRLVGGDLVWGVACGVLAAISAVGFAALVGVARRAVARVPEAALPIVAGVALAGLLWWSPFALTNGEAQVGQIVDGGLGIGALAVAIAAKLSGVLVTLTGRWKGGFIIPLFFVGFATGQLIHGLVPSTNDTVLMAALAAGLCTGVTKTPLGSTLVVTQMSGLVLLPTTLVAALVALALTSRAVVIDSQRERAPEGETP